MVTVIDTENNRIVQLIHTDAEPIWITFSADSSRAYVSNQVSGTVSVIATASGTIVGTIAGFSCPFHSKITPDGTKLMVSSQCDASLKFVDLNTNTIAKSIFVGDIPRGIALTPDGKRAYVTNFFTNLVQVIDVATETNLNTPITVGAKPWGIAMTRSGKAYVANFGDGTISVIDSSTNTVTNTFRARNFPEDVTVSMTARPGVLNYSFKAFDVPGATDTFARGINNRGQNAGSFVDGSGVEHGYLRQTDGSFVTIDPPGSVDTIATSVNDQGSVAGFWTIASGVTHGFIRSPSGVYTTVDFPGATDSAILGMNDLGTVVGSYDLGDPNTSIGFLGARKVFTSIEDPDGLLQTQAAGVNLLNFISGTYADAAGTSHGFVRDPKAQFHNFDFPGADLTIGTRINDFGQVVGNYFTNFPNHGFILSSAMALNGPASPEQFFSFDYPDSRASAARGINDRGQVSGFFFLRGDPVRHGFLATPMED